MSALNPAAVPMENSGRIVSVSVSGLPNANDLFGPEGEAQVPEMAALTVFR
jgi:hypothetical protein